MTDKSGYYQIHRWWSQASWRGAGSNIPLNSIDLFGWNVLLLTKHYVHTYGFSLNKSRQTTVFIKCFHVCNLPLFMFLMRILPVLFLGLLRWKHNYCLILFISWCVVSLMAVVYSQAQLLYFLTQFKELRVSANYKSSSDSKSLRSNIQHV